MKIIGVTGGTGSGKSLLAHELVKCGATVIDADKISRQVSKSGGKAFDEIVLAFGSGILTSDGEINRKALSKIVFNDTDKLKLLENITHKHIFNEMKKQLDCCKTKIVVLDVPLLFSCNFPIKCDVTVAVTADLDARLKRIMERDNISLEMAKARIKNQLCDEDYCRQADICFLNNGDIKAVREFAASLCL